MEMVHTMKHTFKYPITLLTFIALSAMARGALADGVVSGHILVKPSPGKDIQAISQSYGVVIQDQIAGTTLYSLSLPRNQTEAGFAALLTKDSRLVFAETDTFVVDPEVKGDPVHVAFDRVRVDAKFVAAWKAPVGNYSPDSPLLQVDLGMAPKRATGIGITVAVLDTGIDFTHPLLNGRGVAGYNALNPSSLPIESADGATNIAVGHGTMVAGIIARIAPDALLMPVRVLNGDGVGTAKEVAEGLIFAVRNGARVINLSLGSSVRSKTMEEALDVAEAAGVTCVTSAGNNGAQEEQYPSSRHDVLVVGALEADNKKSGYSNYGGWVSVVAPGSNIRSTYVNGQYATWSGTSFATPFVTGEAALILSLRPDFIAANIKDAIRGTARSVDKVNTPYKGWLGKGVIDIATAVQGF